MSQQQALSSALPPTAAGDSAPPPLSTAVAPQKSEQKIFIEDASKSVSTLSYRLFWFSPAGEYQQTASASIPALRNSYSNLLRSKVELLDELSTLEQVTTTLPSSSSVVAPPPITIQAPPTLPVGAPPLVAPTGYPTGGIAGVPMNLDPASSSYAAGYLQQPQQEQYVPFHHDSHSDIDDDYNSHLGDGDEGKAGDGDGHKMFRKANRFKSMEVALKLFFKLGGPATDYTTRVKDSAMINHPDLIDNFPDQKLRVKLITQFCCRGETGFLSGLKNEGLMHLHSFNLAEHVILRGKVQGRQIPSHMKGLLPSNCTTPAVGYHQADVGNHMSRDYGIGSESRAMFLEKLISSRNFVKIVDPKCAASILLVKTMSKRAGGGGVASSIVSPAVGPKRGGPTPPPEQYHQKNSSNREVKIAMCKLLEKWNLGHLRINNVDNGAAVTLGHDDWKHRLDDAQRKEWTRHLRETLKKL